MAKCTPAGAACEPKAASPLDALGWVLVSEPGFFKVVAHFPGNLILVPEMKPRNNSLLDTIFDYTFYFGPPGKYL